MSRIKFICSIGGIFLVVCMFAGMHAFSWDRADIRGRITRLIKTDGESRKSILGTVLIEGVKETDTQYDKATVKITTETKFFINRGEGLKPASFNDLKEGQRVEANFTGPVMESYPVQATASKIVILMR